MGGLLWLRSPIKASHFSKAKQLSRYRTYISNLGTGALSEECVCVCVGDGVWVEGAMSGVSYLYQHSVCIWGVGGLGGACGECNVCDISISANLLLPAGDGHVTM